MEQRIMTKAGGRQAALSIDLVGEPGEQRAKVRAALAGLEDIALNVVEKPVHAPAFLNGNGRPANQGSETADVVMAMFNEGESSLNFLHAQAGRVPRPALFALLSEHSPGLMRRALRAGADEVLFLPLDPEDLTRALFKISEGRLRKERSQGGMVCSVTSLTGGVGVTSLSANLALAFHHALKKRVALVDLDLQTGALAVDLNLEPERTISALATEERTLDSLQLESALSKHASGVYVLAAPRRVEECESVSEETVGAALDLMRQLFDVVVVDCGSFINGIVVTAWERSDSLLYLLDQSIRGTRSAWRFVDLLQRLQLDSLEPRLVLSRFAANRPISESQIARALARPLYATIPNDEKAMERVVLSGQDLWRVASKSALAKAVESLARRLAAGPAEVPEGHHSGVLSRLLAAIVMRARGAADEAA